MKPMNPHNRGGRTRSRLTEPELDRLVEEATVDCYNDAEQLCGLCTMIEVR